MNVKDVEPMHEQYAVIVTRNPNETEETLNKYLDILTSKVSGQKKEDMVRVLSGTAAHCNYRPDL